MQLQALMMLTADTAKTQELVTLVPWTFIAQIINLFIQMFLIKKFLFKPINDILEKRKNLADKAIREAREAQEEADSLKSQYEESLTNAHAEAAKIVSEAQKEAQNKADTLVKEAEQQLGWHREISFEELVSRMVAHDMALLAA